MNNNRTLIREAQIGQLYQQGLPGLIGALAGAIVLTVALWDVVSHLRLVLWLGTYCLLQIPRFWLVAAFKRANPKGTYAESWGKWFALGSNAGGVMWGIAGVLLFPADSPAHQFLLSVFVTGIACGAAATYAPLPSAYVPTILAELTPLSARFIYEGSETNIFIGGVVFLFSFILLLTARNIEVASERSLGLMFEKNDLVASLTDKTTKLERLSESLQAEIEERRRAEESLSESLDEKEVLLREIHHRVKNNLQVMSSLIRLQSRYVADAPCHTILREMEGRVISMALVHEKLYQSDSVANLRLSDYFPALLSHLLATHRVDEAIIKVHVDLDDPPINMAQALPLGFILTELVSNCLKHAFPRGEHGNIRVTFRKAANSNMVLSVSDDGVGLPEHVKIETPETLGLRLVRTFVRQLEGDLAINRNGGTEVSIFFCIQQASNGTES